MPVAAKTVLLLLSSSVFMTLAVFVPFAALHTKQPLRLNRLWDGFCLVGTAWFVFKR